MNVWLSLKATRAQLIAVAAFCFTRTRPQSIACAPAMLLSSRYDACSPPEPEQPFNNMMATAIPEKIFTVVPLLVLASLLALDLYRLWRNKQQLLFRIVIKEFCQGERELNPGKEPLFNQRFRCGYLANACTVMYLHQLQGRVDKPNRLSAGGEILADFFRGILGQVAWGNDLDRQRRRAFN